MPWTITMDFVWFDQSAATTIIVGVPLLQLFFSDILEKKIP